MKLLLIDGADSDALEALERLTADGAGFEYVWAPDVATGVQRLDQPDIDVVLLSLALPDAWGTEAFEKVHAFAAHLPIVLLAGPSESEIAIRCISLGAQDSISVDEMEPKMLRRVMAYATERHRLISALRDLSVIDDFTDLYTLRGLTELGRHHLLTAQRMAQCVLLVYLETRHTESRAVVETAALLRHVFRASDVIACVGPGEFAVLAIDADLDSAPSLVARVLEAAQERALEHGSAGLAFSIGYTGLEEMPGATVTELLDRARAEASEAGLRSHGRSRI